MSEGFASIFIQMVVLFAIVAAGYAAKKLALMDADFDQKFSKLILNVSLPAMILASVLTADELPAAGQIALTFGLSCLSYLIVTLVALLVTKAMRISNGHKGVFRFMLIFGNVGFIGFPVLSAIFGQQAIIYACIFNLPFNFLVFTVGAWFLTLDNADGATVDAGIKTFLSPCMVSCVVAIALVVFGVHDVPVVGDALDTLGSLTTPAALLIIGSSLANMPARQLIGGPRLFIASLFRLVVMPLIVWAVFRLFVADPLLLAILVVISGMPVATNGTMLCYQYGGDSKTMAQGTFVTTVCSLVTIPVLVMLIGG